MGTNNNNTTTSRRAIGYIRVSTVDQAENGISLDAQRARIRAFADLHDLELVDVIEDAGQSGKSLDRPGARELLQLVDRRAVDVVIVAKLDRMTRSVKDLAELVERLDRRGVAFSSVAESIDTSSAVGRFFVNVLGSLAQLEREQTGERTSDALAKLRADGKRISRRAPFGFREELDDDGSIVWREDPREQQAISVIVDLRERGMSLRAIAAELEARGVTARHGRRLAPQTISNVLRREAA